jgi:hypothetical protein
MKIWIVVFALLATGALAGNENIAIHNIGIEVYSNAQVGGCVRISVVSFVSWRLLESDDLIVWREKTKRILKSGDYDIYDVTLVGMLSVRSAKFWRVEELPSENIVPPPQLREMAAAAPIRECSIRNLVVSPIHKVRGVRQSLAARSD